MLPSQLQDIVHEVLQGSGARLGIHCHDDTGCAVANTLAAVQCPGVFSYAGTATHPNANARTTAAMPVA